MSTTIDGSASVTINSGAVLGITSGTVQTAPPSTPQYFDFTGIPSWVKRITVMFNGVSTSGSSIVQVQIGSGSVTASGYLSYAVRLANTAAVSGSAVTSGFHLQNQSASAVRNGQMVLTNISGNIWVESHYMGDSSDAAALLGGGSVTLSGTLDRVRITTVNGTDTFDAGSINIMYEG